MELPPGNGLALHVHFQNLPFDIINSVMIEGASDGEYIISIIRESAPQLALRRLNHCWRGKVLMKNPVEKLFCHYFFFSEGALAGCDRINNENLGCK